MLGRKKYKDPDTYIRRGSVVNFHRQQKQTEVRKGKISLKTITIVIFIMGAVIWLSFSPVTVKIIKSPDASQTEAITNQTLRGINSRNGFLNLESLQSQILNNTSDAVNVSFSHKYFMRRLEITVNTQKPAFLWQTKGVRYLISENGIALNTIEPGEEHDKLPVVFDDANVLVEKRQQVVPKTFVTAVLNLDEHLANSGFSVRERSVKASTREVKYKFDNKPYTVTFDTGREVHLQVKGLIDLEEYFKSSGRTANEYIDLRIPQRAYWK